MRQRTTSSSLVSWTEVASVPTTSALSYTAAQPSCPLTDTNPSREESSPSLSASGAWRRLEAVRLAHAGRSSPGAGAVVGAGSSTASARRVALMGGNANTSSASLVACGFVEVSQAGSS